MNGLILDVIIVVIAILLIIFGIWRGMYKLIFGLVSSLIALVLAVVLASTVTSFVVGKTNVDDMLYEALDESIQGALPEEVDASNVEIVFNADGTVTITHVVDVKASISEYLADTSLAPLGGLLDSLVMSETSLSVINPDAGTEGAKPVKTTLAGVLSKTAIVYILMAIVFIVLWIVSYIVMRLIMLLIKKIVHTTYIGHFLDKVLGMMIGAVLAMVLIWGSLAVIRLLGTYTFIIPVNEIIETSTLTKLLFENNFLYDILVNSTNLQETIASLLGGFVSEESANTESALKMASIIAF